MLKRFLAFVVVGALLLGFGVLFYMNPAIVELHVWTSRSYSLPLPLLVLGSFLAGAAAIFVLALVREAQWTLGEHLRKRREARTAKNRALVAASRELLWHDRLGPAKRALRRAPARERDVEAIASLAETSLRADRPDEARTVLEDGLAIHSGDPRLLALLASVAARENEWRRASALLERAVDAEPDSLRLATSLRDAYTRERRWADALRAEDHYLALLREPRALESERPRRLGLRYELALSRDHAEDVTADLYDVLRDEPTFAPAAVALGDTLRQLGRDHEAGRVWLRAALRRPLPVLLGRIESLYRELGEPHKVNSLYRRLQARGASFPRAARLVRFQLAQGSVEEASTTLESAPPEGDDAEVALLRAEIARRRGDPSAALEALRAAFDAWPDDGRPHLCSACGRSARAWLARCPGCGQWDALGPADPGATRPPEPASPIGARLRRLAARWGLAQPS
jgi:lipopolysaccharide biosynthesis regulator YciM